MDYREIYEQWLANPYFDEATKEELMTIKGIGESKAESIIKYKKENGLFKSLEELKDISGIGNSIYDKIKDYLTL